MSDILSDTKVTQDEANRLMASMELDLTALFNVMQDDILEVIENFGEGTPDQLINEIVNMVTDKVAPVEVVNKSRLFKTAAKTMQQFKDRL